MVETVGAIRDDLVAKHQFSRQDLAVKKGKECSCFDLICSSDLRLGQINS